MAKYKIEIDLESDAFQDRNESREVVMILAKITAMCNILLTIPEGLLKDSNGNTVGKVERVKA